MDSSYKGRREDLRLITGHGQYTADHNLPGQVYGHFLRSDRANAQIVRLDIEAAKALPGVLGIFTGKDAALAQFKSPRPMMFTGVTGPLKVPARPMLAADAVRFVGELVALVVAETEAQALDAVERIEIEYRDLPPLIDASDALAADALAVHPIAPDNLAAESEYGDAAATQAGFDTAALVVEVEVEAQRLNGHPMEPKACLVAYDAAADAFDVYAPTQGMGQIQEDFSDVTGIERQKFRVHAQDVGGAFGVRNEAYPEFLAVLLAARALRQPVKWNGSRSETMLSDHHGRGAHLAGALALDSRGRFLALRVDWLVNLGAYCSNAGAFVNAMAAPRTMAANVYRIPAIHGRHRLVFTHTIPTTAYRGAGRPNVAYLIERLVDEAARITGIDRIALRRRNLIPRTAFPYKTPTGSTYDSADPAGLLDGALHHSDWKGFAKRRREAARRGRLRGIGCATFIEPSGSLGQERIAIRIDRTGHLLLYTLAGPSGQGIETVFPEVVGRILGLDSGRITLRASDPRGPALIGHGSFGSRSLLSHGNALAAGAHEIIRKGGELAAAMLEASADDLTFADGHYRVKGTDLSVSLSSVIEEHHGAERHPLDTTTEISSPMSYPSGAHVSEVEIDPETGVLEIVRYVAVDDCGNVMNPMLVEGQLHGGIMQGIGQAIGEHVIYERTTGQLLTGTLMDYFMPHAEDSPPLSLHFHPVPSPTNHLGVKGTGEAGATGSVPCIANAVMHALAPAGVHRLDMPYTPARIWQAIRDARATTPG